MRAYELVDLIEAAMRATGNGSSEITLIKGGDINDVVWCDSCKKFHIILM